MDAPDATKTPAGGAADPQDWRAFAPATVDYVPSWVSTHANGTDQHGLNEAENAASTGGQEEKAGEKQERQASPPLPAQRPSRGALEALLSPMPDSLPPRRDLSHDAIFSPLMSDVELKVRASMLRPRDRVIPLERVGNVRDFGGLPAKTEDGRPGVIRFNRLFRAAHFNLASEGDSDILVNDLRIRTILDLRAHAPLEGPLSNRFLDAPSGQERGDATHVRVVVPTLSERVSHDLARENMSGLAKLQGAVLKLVMLLLSIVRRIVRAIPLIGTLAHEIGLLEKWLARHLRALGMKAFAKIGLKNLYTTILTKAKPELKKALREASDPDNMPLVFHCQFGKDRTGLLAVLLLHACGVDRKVILDDYALSDSYVDTPRGREEWDFAVAQMPPLAEFPEVWARSPRAVMEQTLAEIESTYGSLDAYLKELEIDEERVRQIRRVLVEG